MEYLLQSMANYGFPMVIAVFLLVRMDRRLAELDSGIRDLTEAINKREAYNSNRNNNVKLKDF